MMKFLQLIVVLACLALASAIGAEDLAFGQAKNGFDYCPGSFTSGEWASGQCGGDYQSPIDLPAMTGAPVPANAITATTGSGSSCTVENNGHTLKYECAAGSLGSFAYKGATFNIKQFHVHFPSEHTFGTQKKDGEVHFVAFKSTANPAALVRGDAIALGAMVDIVTDCNQASPLFTQIGMLTAPANPSTKPCARVKIGAGAAAAAPGTPAPAAPGAPAPAGANAGAGATKALAPTAAPPGAATAPRKMMFRSLIQSMNKLQTANGGAKQAVANINLAATFAALVPSSTAQYEGSLTTPPCNQVVTHVVIVDKYLKVCRNVVDKFTLEQVGVNARPVQSANPKLPGRTPVYGLFTAGGSAPAAAAAPTAAPTTAAPTAPNPSKPAAPAGGAK